MLAQLLRVTAMLQFYEAAIDDKIFARHPPYGEPLLEATPNGAARKLR